MGALGSSAPHSKVAKDHLIAERSEQHADGQDEEHERYEHRDLLAAGLLGEGTLRFATSVRGVGVQSVGERRAPFDGGDELVDGARERRRGHTAGEFGQRLG